MGRMKALYNHLPIPMQHVGVSLFGAYWRWLRFGPGYQEALQGYLARDRWSPRVWDKWQAQRMSDVLAACASRVPHYRAAWTPDERRAASKGDVRSLPLLDKQPLRNDPYAFVDASVRCGRPLAFHTSGSTGTPVASFYTKSELRASLALREARSARWAGVSFRMPRATFSGRIVEPDPHSDGPFYRYNAMEQQVYFSAFHLRPDTAAAYVHALHRHGTQWGTGYAVSFHLLARNVIAAGIRKPHLNAVITTSETLTPEMRADIQTAFGCPAFEEYSTVENGIFASECEAGSLHVSPDVSYVEILRPDGSPCGPEEPGEVVVTSLDRTLHPLIRYRLGDLASWAGEPCRCGRAMPVLKEVVGRIEDVITGPDGRQLVRFHGVFTDLAGVVEGQIVQESRVDFTVRVVPSPSFGPKTIRTIEERMIQRLGQYVHVSVDPVRSIGRDASGKFRAVIVQSQVSKNGL